MQVQNRKSSFKRFFKLLFIVAVIFTIILLGLHIWFVNNARNVLKQIVAEKSHGQLRLELSQLSFNFLSNKLQINEADLINTDTLGMPVTYHVKFSKLTLHVQSFWPLVVSKRLMLDSIKLHDPEIEVTQWRKDTTSKLSKDELSISQEMGQLYNSMLDVLDTFGVKRIVIDNAKLSLINKMKPGLEPVTISQIYFDLIRTADVGNKRDEFIENKQTVELKTSNQNIALPGGRHKLSFKNFSLQLFRKRIELDSCTITAIATTDSKSNYEIFFKKLLLIGVDLDAMYRNNLIKADSVYCENPLFHININQADNSSKKTERPDPDKIIQELTGDLNLAFVGVKDAGIHIDFTGTKHRSLFNSNKDNFEMIGLSINADSSKPVTVKRFDMLVQDYQLNNEDSSVAYTFDSIRFANNKIVLNNFSASTVSTQNTLRSFRDFKIPYFELTGLDWYQLIFEQNLKAQEAVLYNPVINYTKRTATNNQKKTNFFASLATLDDMITLNKITVINGQVNVKLGYASSFNLQNANLSLYSNKLLHSTKKEGLRRALQNLSFSNGQIKIKDITANLQNVHTTNNNLLYAGKLSIFSASKKITASVNDVFIDNMFLDDESETIIVDGIRWKNAYISLQSIAPSKNTKNSGSITIKNISGNNTQFKFSGGKTSVSTFVQSLKIASLSKNGNLPLQTKGVFIAGNNLLVNSEAIQLKTASYQVGDNVPSYFLQARMERIQKQDSLNIHSGRINFVADINSLLSKNVHIKNVEAQSPVIKMSKWNFSDTIQSTNVNKPSISIDDIVLNEPSIYIATHRNDSATLINMPQSDKSIVKASYITINNGETKIGSLSAHTTEATFVKRNGDTLGVKKGKVDIDLSAISLSQKNGKPLWSLVINNLFLQNPNSLSIGKNKSHLLLQQASLGNINLSSEYLTNFDQLVKFNVSAWLRTATGQYVDSATTLKWYNADYNYSNKTLSLDSFVFEPTQPRDSFIAHLLYQKDYIALHTGAIKFTDFNLEKYKKDSALLANTISITNPLLTVYSDKVPPYLAGVRPLPVNMIKRISLPVSVQSVNIKDGTISYTERNAKSRAEGNLLFTRLNGGMQNIKNQNFSDHDSLVIAASALLMDSALINLHVKESYTDSLSGFLVTVRVNKTSLSFLNPALAPLSNVIITSGTIDSFHLRAIAREDLALGEMNVFYHNLRIKMIKNGDPEKSNILTRAASFFANTFLIKKNNSGRTGLVYFKRSPDQAFFSYLIKMSLSGMATSIGFKKNKKYLKQYKQQLKKKDLPPIEYE